MLYSVYTDDMCVVDVHGLLLNVTVSSVLYSVYCGGACSPHLLEVSRHYRVVVQAFASGQCGPGLI